MLYKFELVEQKINLLFDTSAWYQDHCLNIWETVRKRQQHFVIYHFVLTSAFQCLNLSVESRISRVLFDRRLQRYFRALKNNLGPLKGFHSISLYIYKLWCSFFQLIFSVIIFLVEYSGSAFYLRRFSSRICYCVYVCVCVCVND